jgi:hypothetical protein
MNTQPSCLLAILTALGILFLPACTENDEYPNNDPARIDHFYAAGALDADPALSFHFTYNSGGDPVEMVPINPDVEEPDFDFHFRYDRQGRISDVLLTQNGQSFVFIWQRFFYPARGTVGDSTFEYNGQLSDTYPPRGTPLSFVEKHQLDVKGRIVRTIFIPGDPNLPSTSFHTAYDKNGNKIIPGVVYDHKVNIYRSNKVWQLIYQDYSMNNPVRPVTPGFIGANNYDKFGLPLHFQTMKPINGNLRTGIFALFYSTLNSSHFCDPQSALPALSPGLMTKR